MRMEKTISLIGEALRKGNGCGECKNAGPLEIDFGFAFQPIVDLKNRSVFAYEALVRGPAGESSFSILSRVNDQNRYQFDQACRVRAIESALALSLKGHLAVNFLPNAVLEPSACIQTTLAACRRLNFSPSRLVFEVTEGEQMHDRKHLIRIFQTYASLGFQTAIDDFGSGIADLNLLVEFQPTLVKLDIALVHQIETDPMRQAVISGIVRTSGMVGTKVVAKGINTEAERDLLRKMGVHLMQGYLFGGPAFKALPPVPANAWPADAA